MEAQVSKMARDYAALQSGVMRQQTAAIDFQAGWDEANKWIPVTESMPPSGERVLVKCEGKWVNIGKWDNICPEEYSKDDYRWLVGNTNKNWEVTHWRRL